MRKSYQGKQKEICLNTSNKKLAKSKANRFLVTLEENDWETAVSELTGQPVVKAGSDLPVEAFIDLYKDYCNQSAKTVRPDTIRVNAQRLRFIMGKLEVETIGRIDKDKLYKAWFGSQIPTAAEKRTFSSAVRAAGGCFKVNAIDYYQKMGFPIKNPFKGLELAKPKVDQYVPMSEDLRNKISKDCIDELDNDQAMVILMALEIGMRVSEINAAPCSWFSEQDDRVLVHIKEETWFKPKAGTDGVVPISKETYNTLLKLRCNSESKWFVPFGGEEPHPRRLRKRQSGCSKWLRDKGLNDDKPIHALRKELGSRVAKERSILEASKILRNTIQVCSTHYAGITDVKTLQPAGSKSEETKLKEAAKELKVPVEILRKLLR